jgi:DNA topoisomerase-1
VTEVTFTRELETEMEEIERGNQTREHVVKETVEYLKPIIETLKGEEKEIGTELTDIISEMREASTTLIVPCPECGSRLRIVRNPRTKKRFIGCSGKWKRNCGYSLPLPQIGRLKLLPKCCANCGFQLIQVSARARRPLVSCSRCYVEKTKSPVIGDKIGAPMTPK